MPDDRSLFDDEDNQIPDWMRAMEPGAFDEPDDETPPTPLTPPTPWERRPGQRAPATPPEPPAAAPPWQTPSDEAPIVPADEPSPWEMLEEPALVGDFDSFDWSVFGPQPGDGDAEAPEPAAGAPAEPVGEEQPPAPEPEPPQPPEADWWRAENEITPAPAPAEEEEFGWLSPATPEPAAERPPDEFDDLESLFGAEQQPPAAPSVPPVAPSAQTGRTGALRWLDQIAPGDRARTPEETSEEGAPAEPGAIPDWLRGATVDEAPSPTTVPDAKPWPDVMPEFPASDEVPDWFRSLDQEETPASPPAEPGWPSDFEAPAPGVAGTTASDFDFYPESFEEAPAPSPRGAPRADDIPDWLAEPDRGATESASYEVDLGADETSDFVERFEPLAPDEFPGAPAAVEPEAPGWLRDMAGTEQPREELPEGFFDRLPPVAPPPGVSYVADADDLDWLRALDEGEAEEAPAPAPEPAWRREDTLEEDLDSSGIDALLGLAADETADRPGAPSGWQPYTGEDLGPVFAEPEVGELEPAQAQPYEIGGVPDPYARSDDEVPDLGALLAESGLEPDDMPDLEALLREAAQPATAAPPGEEAPGEIEVPAAEPEKRRGRFFGRRQKPEARPPAPPPDWALAGEGEPPPAVEEPQPEWVEELRPSDVPVTIKAGGAEAAIRQKHITELPERLQALREESLRELGAAPSAPAAPLPAAALFPPGEVEHLMEGLVITKGQQARVDRLRTMLETATDVDETPSRAGVRPKRRARRHKLDRLLITLLLLVGVAVPFATDAVYFADDPPPLAGEAAAVARQVGRLNAGDYVVFAFEYGPLSAGVLDPLAEAVLRDALAQGAIPLTLSTNTAGAFHAAAVLDPLADDPALLAAREQDETRLAAGEDYTLLRYLPGDAVGVRALGGVARAGSRLLPHPAFERDLYGEETNLPVRSLQNDIALLVVVSDDSSAVRTWAEQIPQDAVPKVALVTAAIEPLAIPYVEAGAYEGYLADVRDTVRYDAARNAETRTPYRLPDDLPVTLPDPEVSRWHSLTLGAAAAAGLITLGAVLNLLRAVSRRRRR